MPVKKGISYLQRTVAKCRDMGRMVDKTEYFNPYGGPRINGKPVGVRVDVFNFIDILALDLAEGIIAIQCTGPSGHAQHKRKILENEYAHQWLKCGGVIELWSWRKLLKERGGKLRLWTPRIEKIVIAE